MLISDLITQIRTISDMTDSNFITNTQIIGFINKAYAEVYNLIVNHSDNYFISSSTITYLSTTDTYSLPTDFYKLIGIDIIDSKISVKPFNFNERNKEPYSLKYILLQSTIKFIGNSYGNLTLWYIPHPTLFTLTTDSLSVTIPNLDQCIIYSSAIDCLLKEESDVKQLKDIYEGLKKQVINGVSPRDAGLPQHITDVEDTETFTPFYIRY